MDDTLAADKALALALGNLIRDHKGGDVVVMDLRPLNIWTGFFIIATVSSHAHLQGLRRAIKEFAGLHGISLPGRSRKLSSGDEWNLIDLGNLVVHLMTAASRSFYELERLWGSAEILSL